MVHRLEMPDAFSGLARRGRRASRRTGCCRAARRRTSRRSRPARHVDVAELFVRAHPAPRAGVAGVLRRAALPGVVSELAPLGHDVKRPEEASRPHVEPAHVARWRFLHRPHALIEVVGCRRWNAADDDDVTDNEGRSAPAEALHRPVVSARKVNASTFAEIRVRLPGLRVEGDKESHRRHSRRARLCRRSSTPARGLRQRPDLARRPRAPRSRRRGRWPGRGQPPCRAPCYEEQAAGHQRRVLVVAGDVDVGPSLTQLDRHG